MSFFFVGRRAESDAQTDADSAENADGDKAVKIVDMPESGVISHRSFQEVRAAVLEEKAIAQFVSRRPRVGLRQSIRERRLEALKTASAKRSEGRGSSRPTMVTRVS